MSKRALKSAPDPWRQRLLDAIMGAGDTLKSVSVNVLKRNDAYLHAYIHKGTPLLLGEMERRRLSARYRIPQEDLMPPGWIKDMLNDPVKMGVAPQDDAERFGENMSPTRKAIARIMRLPLPYEERIAMVNTILESCPVADEASNPSNRRTTL